MLQLLADSAGHGGGRNTEVEVEDMYFYPTCHPINTLLSSAITTIPAGQISTTYVQLSKHLCCGWKCEWQSCCLSAFSLGSWRLVVQKYCFVQFCFHLVQ